MIRRRFATLVATAVCGVSGCLAGPPEADRRSPADDAGANSTGDGTEGDDPSSVTDSRGPTRGESDVDLESREVETRDEDEIEYLDAEDAVRYVAAYRHTNQDEIEQGEPPEREPVYETAPFERWAKIQCTTAAAQTAADHVNDQLGTDEVSGGISAAIEEEVVAQVSVTTILDREGDVVSGTDVAFDALVSATPETVDVTYVLEDQTYGRAVPVYASYDVLQQE